jgi:hypothetical protein
MIAAMFQDHCPFHSNMKRALRSILYMCRENNTSNLEPKPMQQIRCLFFHGPTTHNYRPFPTSKLSFQAIGQRTLDDRSTGKKKKRQQSEEHRRSKKLGMVFLEHRDTERETETEWER